MSSNLTASARHQPPTALAQALAHAIGNDTDAAYRRGDLFDKRRQLTREWAAFVNTAPTKGGNVVKFKSA